MNKQNLNIHVKSEDESRQAQSINFVSELNWKGGELDKQFLKRGLIHRTKEAAIAHALALIKISGGSIEE